MLPADWQTRLPHNSAPYTSTIVFLVRKGNPKGIKDWDDLIKPGVAVITPNPKTSGGARWNYLAAWGYALEDAGGERARRETSCAQLYKNVPVLDTGARGSTTTFVERGIGDVLLPGKTKPSGVKEFGATSSRSSCRRSDPRRAAGRAWSTRLSTSKARATSRRPIWSSSTRRKARRSPQATTIARASRIGEASTTREFPKSSCSPSTTIFGGWTKAQATHFADGGVFDQIYGQELIVRVRDRRGESDRRARA